MEDISEIYHQSGFHNLRILQQALWDFERFYGVLEEKHRANDAAMTDLLRLLFCLSLEVKAGKMTNEDIAKRHPMLIALSPEKRPLPQIEIAQKKYPAANLYTRILSNETLVNLLVKGLVDRTQILKELKESSFFVTVADEPAWRTVWYAFERTEEEVTTALDEMERAFRDHEIIDPEEILHVFGLRLWLSKINAIPKSLAEVVTEGKAYVDTVYENNQRLPAWHRSVSDTVPEQYGGLGVRETSCPNIINFVNT